MKAALLHYHYRFYKDRFLLSLSLSILAHIIAFFIFFHLPQKEKETTLRPISLGVLQSNPNVIKDIESNTQNRKPQSIPQPKTTPKTPTQTAPQIAQQKVKKDSTPQVTQTTPSVQQTTPSAPTTTESSAPPSSEIDLNALNVPQNRTFDAFATPTPSLSQSLQDSTNHAKISNLPNRVQDELYKLYGTELNTMSKEQKDYLAESYFMNAEVFQQTADRMGYPKLAAYLKQQGRGIIEFTLHPDGHIDGVKIITSTGFEALDDSMKAVVEQSAKSLKRPPKPVTVRLGGHYKIYP